MKCNILMSMDKCIHITTTTIEIEDISENGSYNFLLHHLTHLWYFLFLYTICLFSNCLVTFRSPWVLSWVWTFKFLLYKFLFLEKEKNWYILALLFFSSLGVEVWCSGLISEAARLWSAITQVRENREPCRLWSWIREFPRWLGMQKPAWQAAGQSR